MITANPLFDEGEGTSRPKDFFKEIDLLIRHGFRIFPVQGRGKKPLIKNWQKRATNNKRQHKEWFECFPQANIGVATGEFGEDYDLIVLDIDVHEENGFESLKNLEDRYGKLPETLTQVTGGGGEHRFYTAPSDRKIRNSARRLGPGLDIRAKGGYVVVTPSLHSSGLRYRWKEGLTPGETPPVEAPGWLLVLLESSESEPKISPSKTPGKRFPIGVGQRNDTMFREACKQRALGADERKVKCFLEERNNDCNPPLSPTEIEAIAAQVCKYPQGVAQDHPYFIEDNCIKLNRGNKAPQKLSNFVAKIDAIVKISENGLEKEVYRISGTLEDGSPLRTIEVPAKDFFHPKRWIYLFGPKAFVLAGNSVIDHFRVAVQALSESSQSVLRTDKLGWHFVDGKPVFVSSATAEENDGIELVASPELAYYQIPRALKSSLITRGAEALSLFEKAISQHLALLLLCMVFRSVLCELVKADFAMMIYGRSGSFKTTIACLMQAFFGKSLKNRVLGNFQSTSNAIEKLLHQTKDVVAVIDDFVPAENRDSADILHRVARGAGNGTGRQRMNKDLQVTPGFDPKGIALVTGEDVPDGESLLARLIAIELRPSDVDLESLSKLQAMAEEGVFSQLMGGYISWLEQNFDRLRKTLSRLKLSARDRLKRNFNGKHPRCIDSLANLSLGLEVFCQYAQDEKLLSSQQCDELLHRSWDSIVNQVVEQQKFVDRQNPSKDFLNLIRSALQSGRAHLVRKEGGSQPKASVGLQLLGWKTSGGSWKPSGNCIGRVADDSSVYLSPQEAYAVVCRYAQDQGRNFYLTLDTLKRRLKADGCLKTCDSNRNRTTVRLQVEGHRAAFLHIHLFDNGHEHSNADTVAGGSNESE